MESTLQDVVHLMRNFYLEKLDSEWVKNIIDVEYDEADDLPLEFENAHAATNFKHLFEVINNTLRNCIDSFPDTVNSAQNVDVNSSLARVSLNASVVSDIDNHIYTDFWRELVQADKGLECLKTLLFYFMYKSQKYGSSSENRDLGVQASSLYLLLLSVPGCSAYRAFYPTIFKKAIDSFLMTSRLRIGIVSPVKGKRGARGPQRKSRNEEMDDQEDEDADLAVLSPDEAAKMIRSLGFFINDLVRFLQRFPLRSHGNSVECVVTALIALTCCETNNSNVMTQRHAPSTLSALAYNAFLCLEKLCHPNHGNVQHIVKLIMSNLLPHIILTSRDTCDFSNRALGVIKDNLIHFVHHMLLQLKDDAHSGVHILVQHILLEVPERAEYRQKAATAAAEIMCLLPNELYVNVVKWLYKLSLAEKASHRLMVLEVISKLLTGHERTNAMADTNGDRHVDIATEDGGPSLLTPLPTHGKFLSHKYLLSIIFQRCRDIASTVRSKALNFIAEITNSRNPTIQEAMRQMFCRDPTDAENEPLSADDIELPDAEKFFRLLRRFAQDDKVMVRKSSLLVLKSLMKLDLELVENADLKILHDHCSDTASSVRKEMVSALTDLVLTYPREEDVVAFWVIGVLTLASDTEASIKQKVAEVVDNLLLQRIYAFGNHEDDNQLPWLILKSVEAFGQQKRFLIALMNAAEMDKIKPTLVPNIVTHINRKYNKEAWTLLHYLPSKISVKKPAFAVEYLREQCRHGVGTEENTQTTKEALKVLSMNVSNIDIADREPLWELLWGLLSSFQVFPLVISPMMDLCSFLIKEMYKKDPDEGKRILSNLVKPLVKSCEDHLQAVVLANHQVVLDEEGEEQMYRHLVTLGNASLIHNDEICKRTFLMAQSLVFYQRDTIGHSQPDSQEIRSKRPSGERFSPSLRIQAISVVTLGLLCIKNELQAKRIVPALGRMLDTTPYPNLKSNILFFLSDMCKRYATLVDPLMPQITACLIDQNITVRRNTLILLVCLLQEDYLKMKGSFFYRILQCMNDKEEDIRTTVEWYITERLLKRQPKILLQSFIECIFHYNDYEEHETYNRFSQSKREKEMFSLAGEANTEIRMKLYRFMLQHMSDEQRFETTQKLCQDVLGHVLDGRIQLTVGSEPVLQDAFRILLSDEIKLATLKSRPEDGAEDQGEPEEADAAALKVRKALVSQVVKLHAMEMIVPILMSLKKILEEKHSPLMRYIWLYFIELMKNYGDQMEACLSQDTRLKKEIEFELKLFKQQQRKEAEEEELRNANRLQPAQETQLPSGVGENNFPKTPNRRESVLTEAQIKLSPDSRLHRSPELMLHHDTMKLSPGMVDDYKLNTPAFIRIKRVTASDIQNSNFVTNEAVNLSQENDEPIENEMEPVIDGELWNSDTKMECVEKDNRNVLADDEEVVLKPVEKAITRDEILRRAISTPKGNLGIDITFLDRSNDISAINFNSTISSTTSDVVAIQVDDKNSHAPTTSLLCPPSPDPVSESDFSRIRRSEPQKVPKVVSKIVKPVENCGKQHGGLFESMSGKSSVGNVSEDSCVTINKNNFPNDENCHFKRSAKKAVMPSPSEDVPLSVSGESVKKSRKKKVKK